MYLLVQIGMTAPAFNAATFAKALECARTIVASFMMLSMSG